MAVLSRVLAFSMFIMLCKMILRRNEARNRDFFRLNALKGATKAPVVPDADHLYPEGR